MTAQPPVILLLMLVHLMLLGRITPPVARSHILPSRTTLPMQAHASEQFLAFRDFNDRVNQATRLPTKKCPTVRLGNAVGCTRRDYAIDLRMAFVLEKQI